MIAGKNMALSISRLSLRQIDGTKSTVLLRKDSKTGIILPLTFNRSIPIAAARSQSYFNTLIVLES
jgi:hypothetical protein